MADVAFRGDCWVCVVMNTKVDFGQIPCLIVRTDHTCIFTKVDFGPLPSFINRTGHKCIFSKVDFGPMPSCIIRADHKCISCRFLRCVVMNTAVAFRGVVIL